MLALVTLACLTETRRLALGATVLLSGLFATLSRVGLMAVVMGLLVLAAVCCLIRQDLRWRAVSPRR